MGLTFLVGKSFGLSKGSSKSPENCRSKGPELGRVAVEAWAVARNGGMLALFFCPADDVGSSPSHHLTWRAGVSSRLSLLSTLRETTYAFSTLISAPEPRACSIQNEIVLASEVCETSSMDFRINHTSSAVLTSIAKECTSAGIGAPVCCNLTSAAMHSRALRAFTAERSRGGASVLAI
jgi:hypothetical protein